jgi:F420-dependent oxidoreductase-like protein
MNLGLNLAMTAWASGPQPNVGLAQEAERLGFDAVWTEEAYGSDAATPLAWVGALTSTIGLGSAVWQMPARTPAMAAMTAATLDVLSGGRFRIGLGTSGPQVVEGWHGQPFEPRLAKTREYVEILRLALAREKPVVFEGSEYQVPYTGPGGTGSGRPLKLILRPLRPRIPIYIGALRPKALEQAAEIADGWLPIFMAPRALDDVFGDALDAGFAKAGGGKRAGAEFDIAPIVSVVLGDDVMACHDHVRAKIALYIGGMGSRKTNFSNELIRRFGYDEVAEEVQVKFLGGDRDGAMAAIPAELIDEVALCGPRERIAELLDRWRQSRVTTIICDTEDVEAMRVMAELLDGPR